MICRSDDWRLLSLSESWESAREDTQAKLSCQWRRLRCGNLDPKNPCMSVSSWNSRLLLYSLPAIFQQGLTDHSSFKLFIDIRMQNLATGMWAWELAASIA